MAILRRDFLQTSAALASGLFVPGSRFALAGDSNPPPRIKVGQIGVSHGHANKIGVYRKSDDYEVIGIVEPNLQLRAKAEKNPAFQGVKWITMEELLGTPGLQAVLIETPIRDLLPNARVCLEAGKHVHIDKPAGDNLDEFKQVLELAEQKQLLVQMGFMYRYNPGVVMLREFLQQGWLGEIFELHTVMSKSVGPDERKALAEYPGGTMFELGCHLIDLVVKLLGVPEKVTPFPRHSASVPDGLLDNMLAVFEYPRATASVRTSVIEIEGGERRHLTVCGTEGTFHIQPLDNPSVKVSLSQPRGKYVKGTQHVELPKYARYVADARDMAGIIRGDKKSDYSPGHDLAVQTAVFQACGLPLSAKG
ncbi:MAG: gfo/Idh/MocA family oxidoreductase [Planctomycetota bacterium]|nr:MAG: gfo/Idh/MocA family oxidoreductase [Planctomycetota bacterium]